MEWHLTLSSFFAASISISVMIFILYLMLSKIKFVSSFGIYCITLFMILILIRSFIPLEISITKSYYSYALSFVRTFFVTPRFHIQDKEITFLTIFYFIWFTVFVIKLILLFKRYRKESLIWSSYEPTTDEGTLEVFHQVWSKTFPDRDPSVRVVLGDVQSSPLTAGLFKSTIILPPISYSKEDLYYIFCHELTHHRHKDNLFCFGISIVSAFHWWNPIIARNLLNCVKELQEFLVDTYIIEHYVHGKPIQYLETLTKTLYTQNRKVPYFSKGLIRFYDSGEKTENAIRKRFQYMMSNPSKKISTFGIVLSLLIFLLSFTFVFEPSYRPKYDEEGNRVWKDIEGQTYFIKNGDAYDLYLQNEYVVTTDYIYNDFKDVPVYEEDEAPRRAKK